MTPSSRASSCGMQRSKYRLYKTSNQASIPFEIGSFPFLACTTPPYISRERSSWKAPSLPPSHSFYLLYNSRETLKESPTSPSLSLSLSLQTPKEVKKMIGFDDLRLERRESTFCLSTNESNTGIIRLHAFGKSDGRTTVAFHLTEGRRWLSSHAMSAVESGEVDDGSRVFDKIFHPELRVLRSPSSSRESMKRMLLQLGILCPEILEGCSDSFGFFGSAVTGIAAATGCSAVVVVVEISLFRIYDDGNSSFSSSSSCSPAVEGLEKVEGREGSCCAICLEEFVPGMELARLPCLHVFHGSCVGKWLAERPVCPLCRRCV